MMWYINTMEHYSKIRKKKVMPFVATRIEPENFRLSDVKSQRERQITIRYHLSVKSKIWHR